MREKELSPAQLRHVFGANLRALSSGARSISSLCRALEINRTQYNRYLNGEAFPRPDVLNRICKHFDVDARILLEPLETITRQSCADALGEISSLLSDLDMLDIPAKTLPEGAYLYYRVSYFVPSDISCSLIGFRRDAHGVMRIRGYMPYASSDRIGLPRAAAARRLRGVVFRQLMGFSFIMSMERTPLMVLGGFEPGYLGQENFYFGSAVSMQDVLSTTPILLQRLEPSLAAMISARDRIGIHPRTHSPPLIRGYFDKHKPL